MYWLHLAMLRHHLQFDRAKLKKHFDKAVHTKLTDNVSDMRTVQSSELRYYFFLNVEHLIFMRTSVPVMITWPQGKLVKLVTVGS